MKVHYWVLLVLLSGLGSIVASGCTAEPGGELAILRVPVPSDTCEISQDGQDSLRLAIFDPALDPEIDNAVRIGLIVKNSLRSGDSGNEVNDSGEPIGPVAPNNVMLNGFNVCYYVESDPRYRALAADGIDAIREDCKGSGSTVAVKEFSSGTGSIPAESDAQPESGSVVYATLLRSAILDELFGRDFDAEVLHNLGLKTDPDFENCVGYGINNSGVWDDTCSNPKKEWDSSVYSPWVSSQIDSSLNENKAWGTFPFRCIGDDCTLLPNGIPQSNSAPQASERVLNSSEGTMLSYLVETYGDFTADLPNARATLIVYVQAVGETLTGTSVSSTFYSLPVDLCIGCSRSRSFEECPLPVEKQVCSFGSCSPGGAGQEECVAPTASTTGCPSDAAAECGPIVPGIRGEEPTVSSCGGGYHINELLEFSCRTLSCPN